jgi:hypothetical protein
MSIRHVARSVAVCLAATAALGTFTVLSLAAPAGATTPTEGSSVPGSAVPVGSYTPGPFSSGQSINIVIPANSVFTSTTTDINVVECSAPGGVLPTLPSACDGNTIQGPTLTANSDGSINFSAETGSLYQLFAIPDANLGETTGPVCNLSTPCVLYIGQNQNDFTQPHVFSQVFTINPNGGSDSGANPGDGTPEVPMAIILPIAAMGLIGGAVLIRRRRVARSGA